MRIQRWAMASFTLGVCSLIALLASHLALTDIHHGERDVTLEWTVLRICLAIIVVSQVITLVTLGKVVWSNRKAFTP